MKKLIIKAIYPIPTGYEVLSYVDDTYCDLTIEGYTHMLALIDGGEEMDDYVTVYNIDQYGIGDIDESCRLVEMLSCPSCGERMLPNIYETYTEQSN